MLSNIHTLYWTAGHSQLIYMIRYKKIISNTSESKKFCDDIKYDNFIEVNKDDEMCRLLE